MVEKSSFRSQTGESLPVGVDPDLFRRELDSALQRRKAFVNSQARERARDEASAPLPVREVRGNDTDGRSARAAVSSSRKDVSSLTGEDSRPDARVFATKKAGNADPYQGIGRSGDGANRTGGHPGHPGYTGGHIGYGAGHTTGHTLVSGGHTRYTGGPPANVPSPNIYLDANAVRSAAWEDSPQQIAASHRSSHAYSHTSTRPLSHTYPTLPPMAPPLGPPLNPGSRSGDGRRDGDGSSGVSESVARSATLCFSLRQEMVGHLNTCDEMSPLLNYWRQMDTDDRMSIFQVIDLNRFSAMKTYHTWLLVFQAMRTLEKAMTQLKRLPFSDCALILHSSFLPRLNEQLRAHHDWAAQYWAACNARLLQPPALNLPEQLEPSLLAPSQDRNEACRNEAWIGSISKQTDRQRVTAASKKPSTHLPKHARLA